MHKQKAPLELQNTVEKAKSALLAAALPHVPFDGWSQSTLNAAIDDSGIDRGLAQALFARFCVILLRADRDVLASRLSARNREDADEIERRLARADFAMPSGMRHQVICNNGPLAQTVATIRQHLSQTACTAGQSNQKIKP